MGPEDRSQAPAPAPEPKKRRKRSPALIAAAAIALAAVAGDLPAELFIAAAQVFAQVADIHALAAVLVGGHAGDNLGHHRAGNLKALGAFDHLAVHHGAVVQHVADVDQAAVKNRLHKIICVVEM